MVPACSGDKGILTPLSNSNVSLKVGMVAVNGGSEEAETLDGRTETREREYVARTVSPATADGRAERVTCDHHTHSHISPLLPAHFCMRADVLLRGPCPARRALTSSTRGP